MSATATAPTLVERAQINTPRLSSIDALRGLVMIVMALDHTRDFFSNALFDPTDLTRTTPLLFFTRWITHFCAPVFVLLAGIGAFLSLTKRHDRCELSVFLLTRGLWLMFLEVAVVSPLGWSFSWHFGFTRLQVIWVIGAAMVILAGLVYCFPPRWIAAFGLILIFGHNIFDGPHAAWLGGFGAAWKILHNLSFFLRLWSRRNSARRAAETSTPLVLNRHFLDRPFHRSPRHECLRRSPPLVPTARRPLYPAVIPELHEVSAVAALSAYDPRTRALHSSLCRPLAATDHEAFDSLWPRAVVLLPSPSAATAWLGGAVLTRSLRQRRLAVSGFIRASWIAPSASRGLWLPTVGRLSRVGCFCTRALSIMQMVCPRKTAASIYALELFVAVSRIAAIATTWHLGIN